MGISDANNLGAVMAPAAAQTLNNHLQELNRDINYYDLVLTGDLGCVGSEIFKEYLKINYNLKIKKYLDAGCELFLKDQETYAGEVNYTFDNANMKIIFSQTNLSFIGSNYSRLSDIENYLSREGFSYIE